MTSLVFADTPPACNELGDIITWYETDLQKKTMKDCGKIKPEQLDFDLSRSDKDSLKEKICYDLMTIEAEIETLKIQQVVTDGLLKLVKDTSKFQQETRSKNTKNQSAAARSFTTNLEIAQTVELLLNSYTDDGIPFIEKLREIPANKRINSADLGDRVTELCKGLEKQASDACNVTLFKPGKEAFEEVNSLINDSKANAKQVKKWKTDLAIKKKNVSEGESDTYSFIQMKSELGSAFAQIDADAPLTKEHILAIQKLDEFEIADGHSFVKEIKSLKDVSQSKIAFDTFSLHKKDALLRQKLDTQSRVSVLWENIKGDTSDLLGKKASACENAKNSHPSAVECIEALNNPELKFPDQLHELKANLHLRLLPSLKASISYAQTLESEVSECAAQFRETKLLTESCANLVSMNKIDATTKIDNLNIIKERIASENTDNMRMRNFALEKWLTQGCKTESSSISFCAQDSIIPAEVLRTSGDMMKIMVLFTPNSEAQTHASQICDDGERKFTAIEEKLCLFQSAKKSNNDKWVPPLESSDDSDFTLAPDGENERAQKRDDWIQGGSMILQSALGAAFPQKQYLPYNPYQNNSSPYSYFPGYMSMRDLVNINSYQYGSYGSYMPTPYQAYAPSSTAPSTSNFTNYGTFGSTPQSASPTYFNFN